MVVLEILAILDKRIELFICHDGCQALAAEHYPIKICRAGILYLRFWKYDRLT